MRSRCASVRLSPRTRRGVDRVRTRQGRTRRAGWNDAGAGTGGRGGRGLACSQHRRRARSGRGGRAPWDPASRGWPGSPSPQTTVPMRARTQLGRHLGEDARTRIDRRTRRAIGHVVPARSTHRCGGGAWPPSGRHCLTRPPQAAEHNAVVPWIAMRRPTSWTPRACRRSEVDLSPVSVPTTVPTRPGGHAAGAPPPRPIARRVGRSCPATGRCRILDTNAATPGCARRPRW